MSPSRSSTQAFHWYVPVLLLSVLAFSYASSTTVLNADEPGVTTAQVASGKALRELALDDFRGRQWSLKDFDDKSIVVVAFVGVECPLAKFYTNRLQEIAKDYSDRSVAFLLVDSNTQDSLTEMASMARRQNVELPFLKDVDQKWLQILGATRTPEVFVLDSDRRVRYHGRIDDQYGIGYVREKPQSEPMLRAVDALLAGQSIVLAHESPVGCLIARRSLRSRNNPHR